MPESQVYIDVILPFPLNTYFTYAVPASMVANVETGRRVIVPFGPKRFYTGIIVSVHNTKPEAYETKEIVMVLDATPILSTLQLQFWQWIAEYYMCCPGEVMKAALPASLRLESETLVMRNDDFDESENLSESELYVLDMLNSSNVLHVNEISSKGLSRNLLSVIKSLYEKGAILLSENIADKYVPKTESFVRFSGQAAEEGFITDMLNKLVRAPKQLRLLEEFISMSGAFSNKSTEEVKKAHLLEVSGAGHASLKTLVEKGVFEIYKKQISRLAYQNQVVEEPYNLSGAQQKALTEIETAFLTKNVALLHGVTSSGKTEIYIHLIKKAIEKGQQVLYMLPEIAITAQIINRLRTHFGNLTGIYHSKFSDNERVEIWNRVLPGNTDQYQVVLGVRSSVFLPFHNLGLIIVDEEHETSFKQYDPAPRYHARDAAIVLAGLHNARVLLGTATPSLETYYNAGQQRYGLINLNERYTGIQLPEIRIVNMGAARKKGNTSSHFSNILLNHISETLESKKQIILFQNRRGFSPYIQCPPCGYTPKCKYCDVTLTYHKYQRQLVCHYCSFTREVPSKCPDCGNAGIQTMGFGTEKVEEELALMFPNAAISRMDFDSTRNKHAHEEIIAAFEAGRIDVLVGTQMVTKGLDFENVGLVGILNADNMLNFPDFRAYERSFQLMAQVGGRAGRKNVRGLVVIQTSAPGNPIIRNVIANDFISMYQSQLTERKDFKYPPFYRLIAITIKHKHEETCKNAAFELATLLRTRLGNRVLGPDLPVIARIQNLYLRNILVKLERNSSLAEIKAFIAEKNKDLLGLYKSLQVSVDVDPV